MSSLSDIDPPVARVIQQEIERQKSHLDLIAAENYASRAVLEAQGSVLTNKYAEGYPQRRYYAGCQNVDEVERLAIERARRLFGAAHANVQPHSGAQANMAAYFAVLEPGHRVMAMDLAHGGHLTHGGSFNFSGKFYKFFTYGVDRDSELLDYDHLEKLASQHKPRLIIAGASAYPRTIDFSRFRALADKVGATLMVDMAHLAGLVAAGLHPSPVPHADVVTSTTHKTLRGPRGGLILCQVHLASAVDNSVFPGTQGGPMMHIIAAKAVALLEAMQPEFASYQKAVLANAQALAAELKRLGLRLVSGGTDNHLVLVDLTDTGITGKDAEQALDSVGITANKNAIPFDSRPPRIASGLRLGTPAITTRGLGVDQTKEVANFIVRTLSSIGDEKVYRDVRAQVSEMAAAFPVPA
jgi:glycine hydroxymethyltransferase